MSTRILILLTLISFLTLPSHAAPLRLIIETDAGGDPVDEQSLVRFLLYTNEWDVEGIIPNRPKARDHENLNPVRDGLGIVRRQLDAYGQVHANLIQHDKRYPTKEALWKITVPGYNDTDAGVDLLINAVDKKDDRPIWFLNWGTDNESGVSCLQRALDRILKERGQTAYANFKNKIRLSSADKFADHTWKIDPPFPFWTYPYYPEMDGGRWYWRFGAITKTAGGFDLKRDILENHGPLGALYPTNTTHPQKEGDTMTFLNLIPNGLNDPEHPDWGTWSGRFAIRDDHPDTTAKHNYYWPNQRDTIEGKTNRDNTLIRWAPHIQNDFRARINWCVNDYDHANHPPIVQITGDKTRQAKPNDTIELDASPSKDPDNNPLTYQWIIYPEATNYTGPLPQIQNPTASQTNLTLPKDSAGKSLHIIAIVTDTGKPPLTGYARILVQVENP